MKEVVDLVDRHGFRKTTEIAYEMRLAEISKAWRWPNRIVTVTFAIVYFTVLVMAALLVPTTRPPERLRRILHNLADLYYYIPEIVIFKGIELDGLCRRNYSGRGLDLGCGNGLTGAAFMQNVDVLELHGIDRSNYYSSLPGYKSHVLGDIRALPYANDSFNFIISLGVIDHVEELDQVLREALRVLKPGGHLTFVIQTPLFRESTFWYKTFRWLGSPKRAEAFKIYRDVYDMIFHYYTEQGWQKRLAAEGFASVNIDYIFSDTNLFFYDLLNIQTYFLRFFYAEKAQNFLARHACLRGIVARATERIGRYLLSKTVARTNATRYLIRATKGLAWA